LQTLYETAKLKQLSRDLKFLGRKSVRCRLLIELAERRPKREQRGDALVFQRRRCLVPVDNFYE
jgi:hypothetical protein